MEFGCNFLFLCNMASLVAMVTSTSCKQYETFNVGLTSSVSGSETRRPGIIEALKASTSDFICLQEVWMETDLEILLQEVESVFPHHYSALHASKDVLRPAYTPGIFPFKDKPCGAWETAYLGSRISFCGGWNGCFSKARWEFGECMATECDHVLKSNMVAPSCVSCIFMNALDSLTDAIKVCSTPGKHHNRMNDPGLVVLSKQDLGEVEYASFFPDNRMTIPRGYLLAKPASGVTVACTHLSSNVGGYIEYDLDFANYKAQQTNELGTLNTRIGDDDAVLMGDLNLGPRVTGQANAEKNLDGEFVENYDLLVSNGFRSPYVADDGLCTYCTDNVITGDYPNQILDHVMVKPSSLSTSGATRLYDTNSDAPISDHYGVSVQVCTT